jgi:hypothetical protein
MDIRPVNGRVTPRAPAGAPAHQIAVPGIANENLTRLALHLGVASETQVRVACHQHLPID